MKSEECLAKGLPPLQGEGMGRGPLQADKVIYRATKFLPVTGIIVINQVKL